MTNPKKNSQSHRPRRGTANVADTNVFIDDPDVVDTLRMNGETLIIPLAVIIELNQLKERADIGFDAHEVAKRIEKIQDSNDPSLVILRNPNFKDLGDLNRNTPDHQIIATALNLTQPNKEFAFNHVRLISRDRIVRILGKKFGLGLIDVQDHLRKQVVVPEYRMIELEGTPIDFCHNTSTFPYAPYELLNVEENECVLFDREFIAIRKGSKFKVLPADISAMGISPLTHSGNENWRQHCALGQLLDPSIELVFLQGGAGTGKTLLALASAIEQKKLYREIIITRPMIHLEDEDRMGFLPGDIDTKMSPWIKPILQALNFIKGINGNSTSLSGLFESKKIIIEPLDYIRGMTFPRAIIIVDDGQNLTPHQMKTILTRAGEGAKVIITGDLDQIDRQRRLDKKSSGLAYAIDRLKGHASVGVTLFEETVRSNLASLAEERL